MCKHNNDDNVSPYLRRRLRSYEEANSENKAEETNAPSGDRNANDKGSDICRNCHHRDGEA